ncbi:MAG: Molybdate-binding periplasmic protein precursor [Acidobacteriota bacterium]|jgi:molybdate transport system substrate-binding protein
MRRAWTAIFALLMAGCSAPRPEQLTVAAASNLAGVFEKVAAAYEQQSGVRVVLTYGSTAQLTQQIENGAPFDVFAAADTEHIDKLLENGKIAAHSRAIYARGRLAMWAPGGEVRRLEDLLKPEVKFIAIAQPDLAPYGKAAVEALKSAGLWEQVQPHVVFANNVSMARQYAATGNATVALTAYSLVMNDGGAVTKLDAGIDQALGIVTSTEQPERALGFATFVRSAPMKALLRENGYDVP